MINFFQFRSTAGAVVALLLSLVAGPMNGSIDTQSNSLSLPAPDVNLQPEDVVKIIIDSLANNDHPYKDAGIETTFNFASPANKANTGPLERFTKMVKGPVFGIMLNHKSHNLSEVVRQGELAYLIVQITDAEDQVVHFAFRLGLQSGGNFEGMWLTEAVWPLRRPADQGLKI